MARKQRYGGEPRFYETELNATSATSIYPPTSKAVAEAIASAAAGIEGDIPSVVADTAFEAIYLSANDKVYAVTVDEDGALACTEVEPTEESEG